MPAFDSHDSTDPDADLTRQLRQGEDRLTDEAFTAGVLARVDALPRQGTETLGHWRRWRHAQARRGLAVALGALAGLAVAASVTAPPALGPQAAIDRALAIAVVSAMAAWWSRRSWLA